MSVRWHGMEPVCSVCGAISDWQAQGKATGFRYAACRKHKERVRQEAFEIEFEARQAKPKQQ